MRQLPPIDLHAHIEPDIPPADLTELNSLIFAATRSLAETKQVLARSDPWTIWGVGCHPGLVGAQKAFDKYQFSELAARTAYVSEVGLDGASRVPMPIQQATFAQILDVLQKTPRIISIHSFKATRTVLECLTARPVHGAVLHWWLGSEEETRQAVELGCYFSINAAMLKSPKLISLLPPDRVLPETDHPFGDRSTARGSRRPGGVENVEQGIGRIQALEPAEVRQTMWRNLAALVSGTRCGSLIPRAPRVALVAVR